MNAKKIIALSTASAMLLTCSAFADDTLTESVPTAQITYAQQADMPELPDGETPPEIPEGGMGGGFGNQTPPEMNLPFTDMEDDAWYLSYIGHAYMMGLISGMTDTTFEPETSVTGAQLITMLYRADGAQSDSDTDDSEDESWYSVAIAWAQENSILLEDNGWEFDPEASLTREQMMVILYRYTVYKGTAADTEEETELSFTDSTDISDYALEAVQSLVAAGLIQGDGDTLRPQDSLTRAETAAILVRSLGEDDMGGQGGPGMGGQGGPGEGGMGGQGGPGMGGQGGPGEGGMGGQGGPGMGGFGGSGEVTQGSAANEITEDGTYTDETYESTGDDENALRVTGATVTLDGITVNKSGGATSNTENGDFYGMNAALLATDGAVVTITDATVTSSAQNGNGVFSYGEGTVVNISDSEITTTADNSGGIQTTGGGTTNASNLTINTSGSSAAAIRSDRGGGTVVVDGGTYTSNGYNSPAVYSTADITVSDATLIANNSEALVIEGQNSITLIDCTVSGNMSDTKGTSSDENVHNVMIYQSMSGDAEVGTSSFSMTGGTLTSNNGDMIYVTNTHAIITLSGVEIVNLDDEGCLLRVTGNSASRGWGNAGSNGAQLELTLDAQELEGDIIVDTISTLTMVLSNGSDFTGTVTVINNEQNGTAVENNAVITVESGCTWTLTGDCTITSLTNNGTIDFNGFTITLADGTVLSE